MGTVAGKKEACLEHILDALLANVCGPRENGKFIKIFFLCFERYIVVLIINFTLILK